MKILVLPFVLASCFGIGWAVFVDSHQHADVDLPSPSSQAVAVEVVGLTIRDIEESLELVGSLDADRDVEIQSRVSGQIRSLVVDVGDTIVIGQELLRIDASEQRELVRQSEAAKKVSIAEQRAQELRVSAAKLEHKRQEDLRRQGVGTAQQLEASRSKLEIAKAELRLSMSKVDQAESALEGSRLAVAERRIESPLSGRVAARMVQVGDMAKSDLGLLHRRSFDSPHDVACWRARLPVLADGSGCRGSGGRISRGGLCRPCRANGSGARPSDSDGRRLRRRRQFQGAAQAGHVRSSPSGAGTSCRGECCAAVGGGRQR